MTIPHRDGEFTFGRDDEPAYDGVNEPPYSFFCLAFLFVVLAFFAGYFFQDVSAWIARVAA